MFRILGIALLVIVISLGGGVLVRYFLEGSASAPVAAEAPNTKIPAPQTPAAPRPLCFAALRLEADLPSSQFSVEDQGNGVLVIKRGGLESFLIYPVAPGVDPKTKYEIADQPSFVAARLASTVYETKGERQTSYFVDTEPAFFVIFLPGTPDDREAQKDIQKFLATARWAECR